MRFIVLDKGRIVERGCHEDLLEMEGLYAGLWNRQREAQEARERLAQALDERGKTAEEQALAIAPEAPIRTPAEILESGRDH